MRSARRGEGRDRGLYAVEPGVRIADRQDHLGIGKMSRELAPVSRTRPIDLRPVPAEHLVPVDRLAARRRLPVREKLGMVADLEHVMARPESQMLERKFQGIRPGAAKARADNLQGHIFLLDCSI